MEEKMIVGELVEETKSRVAPEERNTLPEVITPQLNEKQLGVLLNKTPEWAIKKREGRAGQVYSYVPHGYVTDVLNRAFGWDWDLVIDPISNGNLYSLEIEKVAVTEKGRPTGETKEVRHISVAGHLTVRIHGSEGVVATITKYGFGSQTWLPTMEFGDALKAAKSDLLKVCAVQLGIALDLYWDEQAEIQEYEKELERKREIQRMLSGVPGNPVLFISRSMEKFGLSSEQVVEKLNVTLEELMSAPPEKLAEFWRILDEGQ